MDFSTLYILDLPPIWRIQSGSLLYYNIDFCYIIDELSKFADKPTEAGSSLTKCLDEASDEVPWAIKQYTPVYLGATAGMRILRLVGRYPVKLAQPFWGGRSQDISLFL